MAATTPKAPTEPGVRSWWGIPYATAERYRRPVVAEFDPDLPYDRKGVASVQPDSGDWLEADSGMGEDCLNLNVWAPEQPAREALPVAVYIHGGGFEYGANTQITSNVAGLAATGRVVGVSINYRLGALGALSLSQYGGRLAEASNLFLQDAIAALIWIQRNIAHFGGDPDNVTVYGHSGGAYTTFGLLSASSANGLYRRLAGFSGGPARSIPAWWAEELAHRFVTELGVADNPDKLIDLDTASLVAALNKVAPTDLGVRGGVDNQATGVVLDIGQPGAVVHAHPMDVLASGAHRGVDVLLSMASDDMGWWVANDLDRFDPHTLDRVTDEVAGWRISRSRAKKIVHAYDQGGRTPAEVRAALMADYLFALPAARGALAHASAGGNAHLLVIGPAEGAPAVHGTEMYALVGQEKPGRSAEQDERDTRIRDILLDFVTGEQSRLWPAVTDRPTSESVGNPPFEASAHYQAALGLWEGIDRP
ncbi:carboxylesterase family protein [Streptomyces purpurascens]|uniref:carboxylesterase family protein n=1 Tax=Streptomyces purpurascens TaxID=1924 RepID=UPI001673B947|nr:carboxylesterase family protein [Streptomyces purpurascens]MCE7046160.1 carboxylesterase family protein [Streptomyces purpurascens]GHA34479.1 carboxylic ester hydrolase [Streptomyces purpurascens]